jgi:Raf kinase inhibitor-like YbhB/YbcL family protein
MRRSLLAASLASALIPALAFSDSKSADTPITVRPTKMAFELKSPAFKNNERIPKKHTGEGEDVSPALAWTKAPEGVKSFALIMDDPDAPFGLWIHWVLYDIPAGLAALPEEVAKRAALPDGSKHGRSWGVKDEDCQRVGYFGPLPPPGKPHRYVFKLYALDTMLGLPPKATKTQVLSAMKGHIVAEAQLIGIYER